MKALFVHAHFDDFEFVAAGTFEHWRRQLGGDFTAKILICTDGEAGHHFRTREETGRLRLAEQQRSAELGRYQFDLLRLPDGTVPREGCLQVGPPLLAALWQAIRDFEPDYLFCPPIATDTLAGVHPDHATVAEAVRHVAYMINVPHAFTPEYPADETRSEPRKTPVIINVYDGYMFGSHGFDLAVDVEELFPYLADVTWCHQSQIREWLPWVGRHRMKTPDTIDAWQQTLRARFTRQNVALGITSPRTHEVFTVTAWGTVPDLDTLLKDFPPIARDRSHLDRLRARLEQWGRS